MKNLLTTAVAVAIALGACSQAFAQKEKSRPSFGEITPEEINMKSYAKDTSASAVILFDIGSFVLNDDLTASYKRHVRIKFFGADDINEYANFTHFYLTTGQSISKIKGSTYNMENGKMVESKLNDDGIFKGKVDKVLSQLKFTLPNVKPGSIMEYSFTWTMNATTLPSWQFQNTIPTIYSEYETIIPKSFTYRKDMQGFLQLTERLPKGDALEKLIMRDAPAFKIEPFLTTPKDYLSSISYYITSFYFPGRFFDFERSWTKIGNEHEKSPDFGGLVRSTGWLDKTVDPLIAGAKTPEEKSKLIHDYVKSKIAFNDLIDKIPDRPLKKVMDEGNGSSSEINMLMVAMMRRAGLESYPVLISTRNHGLVRQVTPSEDQFNDVICLVRIDGKDKFFDGTNKTLPSTALPERCMNGIGFLVKQDDSEWVAITSGKSRVAYTADFKLSNEGEMTGKLIISRDGLLGGQMRSNFASLGKEKYLTEAYSGKTWEFSSSDFQNMDGIKDVPKETHELVIRDHAQVNGDIIYINPYVAGLETNQFKSETREYPVHMPTPLEKIYTAKIEIPAGYKVDELPPNKMFLLPDNAGKFIYSTSVNGNVISVTSQFSITKTLFVSETYPFLREFYAMVVAKQGEQIVLKKAQ